MLQKKELTVLMINVLFVKMLLSFPREAVNRGANAAWLQILLGCLAAAAFYLACFSLYRGNRSLIETASIAGGRVFKTITGILVLLILAVNFISVAAQCPEVVRTALLRGEDERLIFIIFAVAACLGALMGIEAAGRIHYLFMPIGAAVMAGFLLLLIPRCRADNISPVFGSGLGGILSGGVGSASLFSDVILINLFIPHTENLDAARRGGLKAVVIAGALSVAVTLMYCLTYSYPASAEFVNPVYQMTRMARISSFFSRFESFFEFIWMIMIFLYNSVYVYAMCYTLEATFSLRSYKALTVPVTLAAFLCAALVREKNLSARFSETVNRFGFIPVFGVLFIYAVIAYVLNRKKREL